LKRGDHVIAENFVNKRIGNKNINNDRFLSGNFFYEKRRVRELCAVQS